MKPIEHKTFREVCRYYDRILYFEPRKTIKDDGRRWWAWKNKLENARKRILDLVTNGEY